MDSVRVCTLGPTRALRVQELDAEKLAIWMRDYRGLGEIRAAGHERSVVKP